MWRRKKMASLSLSFFCSSATTEWPPIDGRIEESLIQPAPMSFSIMNNHTDCT